MYKGEVIIMKPQINILKFEQLSILSDYDLVISIIRFMPFENKPIKWYELCKKFRGYNLKVDMFGRTIFIYGLVFNDFLVGYNSGNSKPVKEIYKVEKKYFKYIENIGEFSIFKRVNEKEIIGMSFAEYKRKKLVK